jgi:hypothetical protein
VSFSKQALLIYGLCQGQVVYFIRYAQTADTVRVGLINYALISIYPWFFTVSCLNDNCVLIGIVICNYGNDFLFLDIMNQNLRRFNSAKALV